MTSAQAGRPTATADPDSLEHLQRPRLAPTLQLVGRFEPPAEVKGNPPDIPLLQDARQVLGYKTHYTLLEWWDIFPVGKWWRYAIEATRYLSSRPNYRYFLKSLLSAARQDKIYQHCAGVLKRVARVDVQRQGQRERATRAVCRVCNSRGCEQCDPLLEKIRTDARYLGVRVDCAHCHGAVCFDCHRRYLSLIEEARKQEKPTLAMNYGVTPVPS